MSSSASSVSSQKKAFISTGDRTKLEILLLRTLVTKHTLSNVYAQSKPGYTAHPMRRAHSLIRLYGSSNASCAQSKPVIRLVQWKYVI